MNDSLNIAADTTVGSLVPTVFDTYTRILYPVRARLPNSTPAIITAAYDEKH
ncbi:hypothetical protein [Rhodococcus sp. IEGM1428]|uniref:hypothetical protein n=1 Tax=Rhodococcus sp. IEGM1428 TaxID=3392191 RepID=UPI003D0C296A